VEIATGKIFEEVTDVGQKTGPEAGQYFHFPLALCLGYKTRQD